MEYRGDFLINRYSSRRESLSDSLFNKKLKKAKSYDRIAGYFSSSILEIAGEDVLDVEGKIRVICNSELDSRDITTAKAAEYALRKEWCKAEPEELKNASSRFKKLYYLLKSKKLEVRVLPNNKFGLIHGKAGVITLENGQKTSFLGSANESYSAWNMNYELVWEDDSKEAIDWVQEEFDALWNDSSAIPLSDFIINDIKRISEREVIETVGEWKVDDPEPPSIAVESPVYREEFGLWEHQKYFVEKAFNDHKESHGARYILADQVGLGKTVQLAMAAQLMALYSDKPILIIVPKTLMLQWQEELNDLLDMPSAVWNGKCWVDEKENEHIGKKINQCPRRVGIISQGLIVAGSKQVSKLLEIDYECVIVDECHRARRRNLGEGKEHHSPEPNNLYAYLLEISKKTKSMLLATATPIQMYTLELWDLMNILSQKNDSVLGSASSKWRNRSSLLTGINLITGKEKIDYFNSENWEWIRNPFPPAHEHVMFASFRQSTNMANDDFVCNKSMVELTQSEQQKVGNMLTNSFYANYNPYIRHVIRRERSYLEDTINPATGEPYVQKIEVKLYGEDEEESLVLSGYLKDAYNYAEQFCQELAKRNKGAGFLKTLLLRRIGSSIEAGKKTGIKMLNEWNTFTDDSVMNEEYNETYDENTEEEIGLSEIKNLTAKETKLLRKYVKSLEYSQVEDPKYQKTVSLLREDKWIERGTIIFSQYFDTAKWIADNLSTEFNNEVIGLYAGGRKSGIYKGGKFILKDKDSIKEMVRIKEIRILVGTDAASEGLNLQSLGTLINIDLPWNPTKLEQRKGRIQRIGQQYDTIYIYNMKYKDSIEDRVHSRLSERLKNISDVFGQVPDVLEDVWIDVALGKEDEADKLINVAQEKNPFEIRYNDKVQYSDWESYSKVLDNDQKRLYLEESW